MKTFKKWEAVYTDSESDRKTMVLSVIRELTGGGAGDHSILVGGDTLVYGTVDSDGKVHVFDTKIRASNQDAQDLQDEGEASINATKAGSRFS